MKTSRRWEVPFFFKSTTTTPHPHPPYYLTKDGWFLKRGFRIFFVRKADKIWTLRTTFSKVPTKNEPFGFRFSKDADTNLSVRIPAILRRGGGERRVRIKTVPLLKYRLEKQKFARPRPARAAAKETSPWQESSKPWAPTIEFKVG